MIALTRGRSLLAIAALITALSALAMTIGTQKARSAACQFSDSEREPPGSKPTFNLMLAKTRVRKCSTAKTVIKSFHSCRAKSKATCSRKVRTNWTCSGKKTSSASALFYGSVACKWGSRSIVHTYQQNLE